MLIDTHCHINTLTQKQQDNIFLFDSSQYPFIDSSIDHATTLKSIDLSKKYEHIYTSAGFHPFCAKEYKPELIGQYEHLIDQNPKIVAVGEIGLDYKADQPLKEQEEVLRAFIKLAKDKSKPVAIHNRLDDDRILDILSDCYDDFSSVIFHCFSYSPEFLKKVIEKKGYVSFSLNILRKKPELMQSLKQCPLDSLLLETDSPYMRINGELSVPGDIDKVYEYAARIKEADVSELEGRMYENAKKVFKL